MNLLLDLDGRLHIANFGLAKRVGSLKDPNYSVCDTLEVLVPEIKKETGYDCMVDYYNVGTLAYELATGNVPVSSEKNVYFCQMILKTLSKNYFLMIQSLVSELRKA